MNTNAHALATAFARENGLVFGGFCEFRSIDKTVFAVIFGLRAEDGSIRWFEPSRSDGRWAFFKMPRLILRADGTVFRDLFFNPFA